MAGTRELGKGPGDRETRKQGDPVATVVFSLPRRLFSLSGFFLVLVAFSPLLNGCASLKKVTPVPAAPPAPSSDPLVGGDPAQKAAPVPPPTKSKSAALPALPASNSSASNAAMAMGEPLPGGRLLAIETPLKNPGGGWQGPGGSAPHPGLTTGQTPGGVQLSRPEPIVEPGASPTVVPLTPLGPNAVTPAGYTTPPGSAATNDQLLTQLKARGVAWQHQERVADGVRFTCAVPNRHNPDINRFYEATAGDYAGAVRAVLQQIDAQE